MTKSRLETVLSLSKGLLSAIALTLLGMTAIAALAVYLRASDALIRALNQLLKCLSIMLGTTVSVGRGGNRGFITGMALAIVYMALGYALSVLLGGNAFAVYGMLSEILIGAALGGVTGAVLSNLPKKRRRLAT